MSRKSIPNPRYVIDPMFPIPEGLDELVYSDREYDYEPEFDFAAADTEDEVLEEEEEAGLRPPTTFKVVKQTIREKADGSQVVDLTIEVDDVPGAKKYEFRRANK